MLSGGPRGADTAISICVRRMSGFAPEPHPPVAPIRELNTAGLQGRADGAGCHPPNRPCRADHAAVAAGLGLNRADDRSRDDSDRGANPGRADVTPLAAIRPGRGGGAAPNKSASRFSALHVRFLLGISLQALTGHAVRVGSILANAWGW